LDSSRDAMIPGLNNLQTVGSSPLKRGAKNILGSNTVSFSVDNSLSAS
jgi:hypothetical protein